MDRFPTPPLMRPVSLKLLAFAILLLASMSALNVASANAADGTIIATKGADRSASSAVSGATTYADPVAGATFEYTQGNPTSGATSWTAFPGVTLANGQASVTVAPGIYFVRERSGGTGTSNYGPVRVLTWSGGPQPYVARVRVESGETTYAAPHFNADPDPSEWDPTNQGSLSNDGSPFINVRDNQAVTPGCGKNLLLVLDRSGSIEPFKDEYREATKKFVQHLDGTPTQIGIISFNDSINSYDPATGNASYYRAPLDLSVPGNAALLNATIDSIYASPNSLTNWDGVLNAASKAKMFTPNAGTGQTANPDTVIFITDGNPTTDDTVSSRNLYELTAGMASANSVKSQAARATTNLRILALGVGNGVTVENLSVVSGPDEGIDGDYANPTVAELEAALDEFTATQCGGRVYIRKRLTGDATNQAGWFYTATDPRAGFTPTYLDGDRSTHSSGTPPVVETAAFFQKLPAAPTTVTIAEDAAGQPVPDFELTDIECRDDGYESGPVVSGVRSGLQYSLELNEGDDVYCTFTNEPRTSLTVDKTPNNQTINAGEDVVFGIDVSNSGQSAATNVQLDDTLPAPGVGGWTITSQPVGDPCTIVGNDLSCSFGSLAVGETVTVEVKTGTSFDACGVYDNPSAIASADNAGNASDSGKITCQKPDLTVDKTPDSQSINAGEDVAFTVQVDNAGPGVAKDVTLSDPLPSGTAGGWAIDSQPAGNPCSITAGTLSCVFGDLAPSASRTVEVKASTSFAKCEVYDNTATVSASNAPDDSDSGQVSCQKPSLTVSKSGNGTINAGEDVEFTVQVENGGPGTAEAVTLSDTLPSGTAGPWTISSQPAGDPCAITGNQLERSFGDMASGASRTVTVTAPTSYAECGVYVNNAIASAQNAPDVSSNDATVRCLKPSLSVEKSGNGPVNAGDDVVFSIVVENGGPGTAKAVSLDDSLPSGTAGPWTISSQPAGDPCSITGSQLDCAFGDLASGASQTVEVTAPTSFAECSVYDNTATASSTNAPDAGDDASVTCREPGLSVQKVGTGPVDAGENIEFAIVVSNNGAGTARAVTLVDNLPSGTAGPWTIETQPPGDPCSITGNTLNCSFGDLVPGQSVTVDVDAPTDYDNCTTYDNTATASSTNAPNASDDASLVCNKPDLSIEKTGNGSIKAGQNVKFTTTVSNAGPGTAKSVILGDTLPNGVAGDWTISSQPAGDPCSIASGTLSCSFGSIAAGESVTVTVKAPTSETKCGVYDNTASALANNHPEIEDDASVKCQKPAPPKPNLKIRKTADKKKVLPGDKVRYRVWVRNTKKGSVAKNVKVCDRLPKQMTVAFRDKRSFFDKGRLCWNVKRLPYSKNWKTHFHYTAQVNRGVAPGTKLKNVATVGKKKAEKTVVVKRPKQDVAAAGGKNTPVTG